MNLKHVRFAICAAAIAAATGWTFPAAADMAFAYKGRLVPVGDAKISTKVPMTVEFRLFRSAEPSEPTPLWGRLAPVRFYDDGSFYIELSDAIGTATQNAQHKRLADAFAAAGTNAWLSVKPAGYGELLPRKRVSGVHRAERADAAKATAKLEAPSVKAQALTVGQCSVGGDLEVSGSFASGGGKLVNTIDGTTPISIGAAGGSVIVSSAFNNWYDLTETSFNVPRFGTDMLILFKNDSTFGVLSLPVQGGTPGSGFTVRSKAYQIQMFLNGYFNPFF